MLVLVTGGSGLLGGDLAREFKKTLDVRSLAGRKELDLADTRKTVEFIRDLKPDVIVHSAAWRDIDGCEADPGKAYRVNVLGTRNVCLGAMQADSVLAYISSDAVFDGENMGPYIEFDAPAPCNVYGKTKAAGEQVVASLSRRYFIVRAPLLFGIGQRGREDENALIRAFQNARDGRPTVATMDQVSSACYTVDMAHALSSMLATEYFGVYHVANSGSCSRAGLIKEAFAIAGFDSGLVEERASADLRRNARRPRYTVLGSVCLEETFGLRMRPWQESLADCVSAFTGI